MRCGHRSTSGDHPGLDLIVQSPAGEEMRHEISASSPDGLTGELTVAGAAAARPVDRSPPRLRTVALKAK